MNVNNGQRVAVTLPGFSGMAGLVEREVFDELSFPARLRALPALDKITVDGAQREVLATNASPYLPNFVVLQLAKGS